MREARSVGRRRLIAPLGIAVAAALAVSGCTTQAVDNGGDEPAAALAGPGVNAETQTITIGEITAMSGPISQIGIPVHEGLNAYIEWVNANGGIDGWSLSLVTKDSGYNPQTTVELYNEIRGDVALLSNLGTPTTAAILGSIEQDHLVTSGVSVAWSDSSELALVGTPYGPEAANLISYIANEAGASDAKFGIFLQNDGFGEDNLAGYAAAVESLGLNSVAETRYNSGDTDFRAQAAQLKDSGAEYVFIAATAPSASGLIGAAKAIGYTPTWVLAAAPAADTRLMSEDGTAEGNPTAIADVLAGGYAGVLAVPLDPAAPAAGFADIIAAHEAYASGVALDAYFTLGWNVGVVYGAILEKAIASGDLSRQGVLAAKTSLGEVDMQGRMVNPSYTSDSAEPPSRASTIAMIDPEAPGFLRIIEDTYLADAARTLAPPR